ncbi:MAG: Mu-like prophage major head subunit gpT family protein [Alphaproteobacteria bacterium]
MKRYVLAAALAGLAVAVLAAVLLAAPSAHAALPSFADTPWAAVGLGGLIVNRANLALLTQGFKASFQGGLAMAKPQYELITTRVPSATREEKYGWLGQVPNMREWLGDRVVHGLAQHDYAIVNKDFELTVGVDRNDIEDDQYGVYAPLFTEMGRSTAAQPDQLVWAALAAGFAATGYDGQYFFDSDHPVLDANGNAQSVANTDGGSGTAWYLLDLTRAIKPLVFQDRKAPNFVAMTAETDENVFNSKKFVWGVDRRNNVGYGLWQLAWGSKQTLNKANYKIAREALMGLKGDYGRPLGLMPTHLVVPPSLEGQALEILNAERDAAGATNVYKGTASLVVVPWLA